MMEEWVAHMSGVKVALLCPVFAVVLIGASLSKPHINGTAMRAIYGIYIYVYMYICMVRPSSARRFIDPVRTRLGLAQPHAIESFVLKSHPCTASGLHAIFCAEKSALKNNCDSML